MFEKLAVQYYEEDELSVSLINEIKACMLRAEAALQKELMEIIRNNHVFHDWYVTSFNLYCEENITLCRIQVSKRETQYVLKFDGVVSVAIYGEIASSAADYPPRAQGDSFAQVLAFWIDYTDYYEICLLLDNERYIIIKAKAFMVN
ncbi:MAG: hypothetical protein E7322_00375 [Clostridiales bacterium]|nr:hypothetical protein [Clostridiales bacterium]